MGKNIEKLREITPKIFYISIVLGIITLSVFFISTVFQNKQAIEKRFPTGSIVRHKIGNVQGIVLDTSSVHVRVRFVSPISGPQAPTECTPDELVVESEQP